MVQAAWETKRGFKKWEKVRRSKTQTGTRYVKETQQNGALHAALGGGRIGQEEEE
ncbi:MAG: hypothetical protein H7836_16645 [Magnetococcus sp. YQC-3]